jgi:uncharacterized protein (TIGR00369 family)
MNSKHIAAEKAKWKGQTGPHQFEMTQWICCAPFERLLNMTIIEAAGGKAVLTMPFLEKLAQGGGLMHGGALVSLADTAVAMAIKSLVDAQTHFATISMKTKFLYPVKEGCVRAEAQITKRDGRRLCGQATIYDEKQNAVMTLEAAFKIAADAKIMGVHFRD